VAELEHENDEIRRYAAAVMQREIEQRAAAEKSQNARDAAFEAITKGMAAESAKRLEEEELRNELLEAEAEEEAARREADAKERALRQRLDIALANEYQRELKRLAREEEKKAEDALRTSMLERFAAEDRIDQMNAQKRRMKQLEHRRMKQLEHRREVERLLEQRREAARAAEAEAAMGDGKAEEERMRVVNEERRRMLAAASRDLGIEHLPPGVLQSADDLELFRAAAASST